MPVYSSIYDSQYFHAKQGQPATEFLDSFLTADNVIRDERNDTSEEEMKEEHGNVSASTLLDFFNQLQGQVSPHIPQDKIKEEPLMEENPVDMEKDRQKKDNHNQIERRRRFNINDRIKDLGTLLPKVNEPFHEYVKDVRPNKGSILRATVEYVKMLKKEQARRKAVDEKCKVQEFQNRKLLLLLQEYEKLMSVYGVPVDLLKINEHNSIKEIVETSDPAYAIKEDIKEEIVENEKYGIDTFYVDDTQPVSSCDPMLSSMPIMNQQIHLSTTNSFSPTSSTSSDCSSLDSFDILDLTL